MRPLFASLLAAVALAVPASAAESAGRFVVIASGPSWSPNGDSLAYTQQLPGERAELVLVSPQDGSRRVLAQEGYVPQFSPLGGLLAYVGRNSQGGNLSELRVADTALLAGGPQLVADDVGNFAWSPDGQELYYDEGWKTCAPIHAVSTYDLRRRRVVVTGAAPVPSPDGKLLAYFTSPPGACTGGFGFLSVANIDGTNAHVVVAARAVRAVWSPNSKELAVEVQNGTDSLIELADVAGPESVLVAHATHPAWSPDGHTIAFLTQPDINAAFPRDEPYLETIDLRTRDASPPLLSASAELHGGPVWSPSGEEVALSRADERGGRTEGVAALNRYVSLYAAPTHTPAKATRLSLAACEVLVPKCTLAGGPGGNVLAGTDRRDVIWGYGGDDRLDGGGDDDQLHGGSGNDTLVGGAGRDVLAGGSGRDVLLARDGVHDSVYCGSGYDVVVADRFDSVARDCERVLR